MIPSGSGETHSAAEKRMTVIIVDAHAHLDRYEGDQGRVIDEIESNRILTVSPSMNVPSYRKNLQIAAASDRLVTETDNPGALKWLRGDVGMPSAIRDVVECTSDLKGLAPDDFARTVHGDFRCLLWDAPGLPDGFRTLLEQDDSPANSPT